MKSVLACAIAALCLTAAPVQAEAPGEGGLQQWLRWFLDPDYRREHAYLGSEKAYQETFLDGLGMGHFDAEREEEERLRVKAEIERLKGDTSAATYRRLQALFVAGASSDVLGGWADYHFGDAAGEAEVRDGARAAGETVSSMSPEAPAFGWFVGVDHFSASGGFDWTAWYGGATMRLGRSYLTVGAPQSVARAHVPVTHRFGASVAMGAFNGNAVDTVGWLTQMNGKPAPGLRFDARLGRVAIGASAHRFTGAVEGEAFVLGASLWHGPTHLGAVIEHIDTNWTDDTRVSLAADTVWDRARLGATVTWSDRADAATLFLRGRYAVTPRLTLSADMAHWALGPEEYALGAEYFFLDHAYVALSANKSTALDKPFYGVTVGLDLRR